MAWIRIPGVTGKIYEPEDAGQLPKKHPCPTCHRCQWCDENRCRVCRGDGKGASKEPSGQGCGCRQASPVNHKFQAPNSK
jgi:hypothetical protein